MGVVTGSVGQDMVRLGIGRREREGVRRRIGRARGVWIGLKYGRMGAGNGGWKGEREGGWIGLKRGRVGSGNGGWEGVREGLGEGI